MAEVAGGGGPGAIDVRVGGRIVVVPAEHTASLVLLGRFLAERLQLVGRASLRLADAAGALMEREEQLVAALQEGRHPLQASLSPAGLRDMEVKKAEAETAKEELTQFQWQVVRDHVEAIGQQATGVEASMQAVRAECREVAQRARAEEAARAERAEEALAHEARRREAGFAEVDARLERLALAVCEERSARDVASHQLAARLEALAGQLEADREALAQDRAEVRRLVEAAGRRGEAEEQRGGAHRARLDEAMRRLEEGMEARAAAELRQQGRIGEVEAVAERVRATTATLEAGLAAAQRALQDLAARQRDGVGRAASDEAAGSERCAARVLMEIEALRPDLDVRLARVREAATAAHGSLVERVRVLEGRCEVAEREVSDLAASTAERCQALSDKADCAAAAIDSVEAGLQIGDVLAQTTASRAGEALARLELLERDCTTKIDAAYWQPQMDALERAGRKIETRLAELERGVSTRLQGEATRRDALTAHVQESLKTAFEKLGQSRHVREASGGTQPTTGCVEVATWSTMEGSLRASPWSSSGAAAAPTPVSAWRPEGGRVGSPSPARKLDAAPPLQLPSYPGGDGVATRLSCRSLSPVRRCAMRLPTAPAPRMVGLAVAPSPPRMAAELISRQQL